VRRLLISVPWVPVIIAVVLIWGLAFWGRPDHIATLLDARPLISLFASQIDAQQIGDLGSDLIGGAVVAVAVLLAEVSINERVKQESEKREHRLREESERRSLQLTLGLHQDLSNLDLTALCSEVDPGSLAQPNAALTCPLSSCRGLL